MKKQPGLKLNLRPAAIALRALSLRMRDELEYSFEDQELAATVLELAEELETIDRLLEYWGPTTVSRLENHHVVPGEPG